MRITRFTYVFIMIRHNESHVLQRLFTRESRRVETQRKPGLPNVSSRRHIFFVGGILETLSLAGDTYWFIFIPYHTEPLAGTVLSLTLIIGGFALMIYGITVGISYSRERGWYMRELRKATSMEEQSLMRRRRNKKPRKRTRKT
ncbi:hypothetical protein KAU55_04465 [Candidatus Bathyarchaeota archaeon]|nr:hypothetical protein [Candidatus Bathyarchaeota archaeon]